jgi:hypothetical protein
MEKQGLYKLSKRLEKLEENSEPTDDDLLDILNRKQKTMKKQKLQEFNDIYISNLSTSVSVINKDNFFSILKFTIHFVEENLDNLSQILLTKKSDELVYLVCIDFMNKLFTNEFSDDFIQNCIIGIKILENTNKNIIDEPIKIEKKKSFFKK